MAIFHYHMQSIGRNVFHGEGVISAGVNTESGASSTSESSSHVTSVEGATGASKSSKSSSSKIKPNRSAVACAAYRSGTDLVEKVYDKESGLWFDRAHNYSYKAGVVFSQMFAPEGAPAWMLDRGELWNRIQNEFDTAKNSVFAKEMDVALPCELSVEQNIELVSEFVEDVLVSQGLVVDVNFHNDNPNNPHMHIMTSTRHIVALEDGSSTFGNKIREIDSKSFLHYLRSSWASYVNKNLEKYGFAERVDHRSYKDREILVIPSIHEGVGRHSENSDRARINAEIMKARSESIVANPEQVVQLLGIEKAYFTPAKLEEKIASLILDDSDVDSFSVVDSVTDKVVDKVDLGGLDESGEIDKLVDYDAGVVGYGSDVSSNSAASSDSSSTSAASLEKFRVDNDGNIILDTEGYKELGKLRASILSSVLGGDSLVKLDGLSELGEYYTTSARARVEVQFLDLVSRMVDAKGLGAGVGVDIDKGAIGLEKTEGNLLFAGLNESEIRLLASRDAVNKIIKTDEQQFVVRGLIEGGSLVQLYGYAGTGKSTVLKSVREIYDGRDVSVVGLAPTAKSRGVLSDLGIEAQTLHALKSREEWVEGILLKMEAGRFEECREWEMSFARNYKTPFDSKTVFMLDEASMVDLGLYSWLIDKCIVSGAKLISIGDYNQLPVVKGIGGGFRALVDNFSSQTFSLNEVWRQKDAGYKEITSLLASYKVSEALVKFKEEKPDVCKFIDGDRRDAETRIVSDYVSWFKEQNSLRDRVREGALSSTLGTIKYELGSALGYAMDGGFIDVSKSGVIISYLREDITRLNHLVREDLYLSGVLEHKILGEKNLFSENTGIVSDVGVVVKRGALGSGLESISLLLGEQIMFLKNDKRVGLYNGEVGTILDIREFSKASKDNKNNTNNNKEHSASHDILVRIHGENSQRIQWFNSGDYGHFDYGYASTIHKVQGSSYNKIFFDFSKYIGFESFYVGVTRHIQDLSIYFNKAELVSILHHRYGVDSANGSNRSIILKGSGGDDRNLYFAALEAHVSRRSSDIFVSKFTGYGRGLDVEGSGSRSRSESIEPIGSNRSVTSAESIFAEYQKIRNATSGLYREILQDTASSTASSGSQKVSDHGKWNEFKDLSAQRGELAKIILSDIGRFESCLKITKANMSVIRDHAGLSFFGVEKVYRNTDLTGSRSDLGLSNISNFNIVSERAALLFEYRNICDMQMEALYSGNGNNEIGIILANLIHESGMLSSSQKLVAGRIEQLSSQKVALLDQVRVTNQDIEVCSNRLDNIADGLGKIYSGDSRIVVEKFSQYLNESGVSIDELSRALKLHEITDGVRSLELNKIDLGRFGEVRGNEYNLGLFKLSGSQRRQNLANREFVVSNIVEYLITDRDHVSFIEKKNILDKELGSLTSSYDKDMKNLESKFLGHAALNHLEKLSTRVDVSSLGEWIKTSEGIISGSTGYELIRRESAPKDLTNKELINGDLANIDLINLDNNNRANDTESTVRGIDLKRSELQELKLSLLSRIDPSSIASFFEQNRGDVGVGDNITIRSGVLKCGSFNLNLSGEKAGQWYRFSRSEGGDIYKLSEYLGVNGSGGEWNNFKVLAKFAGIDVGRVIERSSDNIFSEISQQIQNMRVGHISSISSNSSGFSSDYVSSYKDKWGSLARVPSNAPAFDVSEHTPYIVGGSLRGGSLAQSAKVYDYKDVDGNLIGHMVRVEKGDGAKAIYPISYCTNHETGEYSWRVKGFADGNIIYEAEKLSSEFKSGIYKDKPILIVEGEKTCDAAQKLVGDKYAVISWSGGSSAANKVDWSGGITERDVMIFPDNDIAGIKAAGVIEKSIRDNNIEVKSLEIIDVRFLGLEEGWDLADKLPESLSKFSISEIIGDSRTVIDSRRLDLESRIGSISWSSDSSESIKTNTLEAEARSKLEESGLWNSEYKSRLAHELSVIEKSGYAEDFRVAANIVKFCRSEDIEIGFGRGSAVGSLTAYALGIHNVDPVKYDLSFERFLSEGKANIPDFDIDVSSKDREKVVDYLFQSMGDRAVLMSTIEGRRHPSGICILPEGTSKQSIEESGMASFKIDDKSQRVIMHLSSDSSFKDLEKEGFRKVDLLSSQVLDKVDQVIEAVNKKYGTVITSHEVSEYAMGDKETYALIARGDTDGIFQLESDNAKDICRRVQPHSFQDLVNILALNRPGTMKFVELFEDKNSTLENENNKDNDHLKVFDPKGVFASTKGAILFQEQVMEVGIRYFGIEQKDADSFRRDLEKTAEERTFANKEECINRATKLNKDMSRNQASNLYDSLEKFAEYGYNKSHAVAYAKQTLVTAYLKTHYRNEFCKGVGIEDIAREKSLDQTNNQSIRYYNTSSTATTTNTSANNLDFMKDIERLAPQVVRNLKTNINSSANVHQMIKSAKSVILEDKLSGKLDNVEDVVIIKKSVLSYIEYITRVQNTQYSDLIDIKWNIKENGLTEDMEDDYANKASEKMNIEIKSEIKSKIYYGLGIYKTKEYGGSNDHDSYKIAEELYSKRGERIEYEFKNNEIVKEFENSSGSCAAKYFATQIVDYKMQQDPHNTGVWETMLTERRIEIMKSVSYQQALFDKQIDGILQAPSSSINNNGGQEHILTPEIITTDKLVMRELAQLRLCRDMTMKMQEMGIDKLDVATAQKMRNENLIDSTKALENHQSTYISDRAKELEDNKERQMSRSHGFGMEM